MNSFEWTSSGTARSRFEEICGDDSIKEQITVPPIIKSLKKIKKQFSEENIGSELFYQAFEFLVWIDKDLVKEKKLDQRTLVLLTGLLLMRRANIYGSSCIPWELFKKNITDILLKSGVSKKDIKSDCWKKWMLTSLSGNESFESKISKINIFLEKNSLIYFYKNFLLELELGSLISNRLKTKLSPPPKKIIVDVLKFVLEINPIRYGEKEIKLSFEQQKALFFAISSPFLIITGGPGTGKTSLIVILLRVLKMLGFAENPALVSPTGRAAKRMYESVFSSLNSIKTLEKLKNERELLEVATNAKTLHRLLGYNHFSDSFKFHEFEPLDNDLLIVDEVSMIDQSLMTSLLKASNSKLTHHSPVPRIILLGDPDQLPSVGGGAVLSGLTSLPNKIGVDESKKNNLKIVRLSRNFRQGTNNVPGRNILQVAQKVKEFPENQRLELLFKKNSTLNQGTIQIVNNLRDVDFEKVFFINQPNSIDQLNDFTNWWVEKFLINSEFCLQIKKEFRLDELDSYGENLKFLFSYLDTFRILTLTQVFSTGSKNINGKIRNIWLAQNYNENMFYGHYPGEPIMVTKNDYMLNLFNGDMGIFLKFVNPENGKIELKAVFQVDGVFKTFFQNELSNFQTAYAITVHKSQGSEFNNMALILPRLSIKSGELDPKIKNFKDILTNQIIYTAITRAKESVLILGEKSVFEFLLFNKVVRFSGLANYIL